MTDDELRGAFEACTLDKKALDHRTHLRLAWIYLHEARGEGPARFTAALLRYTMTHGVQQKYHETMTRAWLHLVTVALAREPAPSPGFDAFLGGAPELADARAWGRHYREATMFGDVARAQYVEPDLEPFEPVAFPPRPR